MVDAKTTSGKAIGNKTRQRYMYEFFKELNPSDKQKRTSDKISPSPLAQRLNFSATDESVTENDPEKMNPHKRQEVDKSGSLKEMGQSSQNESYHPKRIDFSSDASQMSEIDQNGDIVDDHDPESEESISMSQNSRFSQDEMDFLTPQDQPVVPFSNPNTPSPLKKRYRRNTMDSSNESEDDVNHLTQDMDVLDVCTHNENNGGSEWKPSFRWRKSSDENASTENGGDVRRMPPSTVKKVQNSYMNHARGVSSRYLSDPSRLPEVHINPFDKDKTSEKRKRTHRRRPIMPSAYTAPSARQHPPVQSKYWYDFVELEMIGSGSFSQVFKCLKRMDGWVYAIKKSKKHFRGKADKQRALSEVYALAALGHSQHVVRYFNAWIEDELLYIQLEYCPGGGLFNQQHEKIKKLKAAKNRTQGISVENGSHMTDNSFEEKEHYAEEDICLVLSHIAKALQDIHALGLAHLDVKPSNILTSSQGLYKLGDFGTVVKLDSNAEIIEGDNRYLSREMLQGSRAYLQAGDIFALGITIYEMALQKELPGSGDEWHGIRDGNLVSLSHYSCSLQHLIRSMMHPDPLQRPSASQIVHHPALRYL